MRNLLFAFAILATAVLHLGSEALAFTANKVWFEFKENGRYRVHVNYTVPALREFRESFVEFSSKKEAEKFYFSLLKGADFYIPNSEDTKFVNRQPEPHPW